MRQMPLWQTSPEAQIGPAPGAPCWSPQTHWLEPLQTSPVPQEGTQVVSALVPARASSMQPARAKAMSVQLIKESVEKNLVSMRAPVVRGA